MARLGIDSQHLFWRRLTAWMAIYALVVQGILVGLVGAHATAGAASGYEICLHDDEDAGTAPSGIPGSHEDKIHCPLCVAGAYQVVAPTRVPLPASRVADAGKALWPVSDRPVAGSFRHSDHRSRAPPIVA